MNFRRIWRDYHSKRLRPFLISCYRIMRPLRNLMAQYLFQDLFQNLKKILRQNLNQYLTQYLTQQNLTNQWSSMLTKNTSSSKSLVEEPRALSTYMSKKKTPVKKLPSKLLELLNKELNLEHSTQRASGTRRFQQSMVLINMYPHISAIHTFSRRFL